MELGNDEQTQSLGAGAGTFGAREHHVHDVVGHVVFAGSDEPLGSLDVPRSVAVVERLRASRADVGACIGLGEHHRGAPPVVDHQSSELLLGVGTHGVDDGGEVGAGHVEEGSGVGAEHELAGGPPKGWRCAAATEVLGEVEPPPLGVHEGAERLLETLGHGDGFGLRVVDGGRAVSLGECFRQGADSEPVDLMQDLLCGVGIHLSERTCAHALACTEDLEEVEFQVPDVALVVRHVAPLTLWTPGVSFLGP